MTLKIAKIRLFSSRALRARAFLSYQNFESAYNPLVVQLDSIRAAAPTGKPVPAAAKAAPGTTDAGAKAYGDAYKKAKDILQKVVDGLTAEDVNFLDGLGFANPNDEKKKRTDVLNSALAAWDKPASKYMKSALGEGDGLKPELLNRLKEFDTAIRTQKKTPVKPDQ